MKIAEAKPLLYTQSLDDHVPDLKDRPALAALVRALLARKDNIADFKPLFRNLMMSRDIKDIIDRDLEAVSHDPLYELPSIGRVEYIIFRNDHYSLNLALMRVPKRDTDGMRKIEVTLPAGLLLGVLKGTLSLDIYTPKRPARLEVFDPGNELIHKSSAMLDGTSEPVTLARGSVTPLQPHGNTVVLVLKERKVSAYYWEVDMRTLRPRLIAASASELTRWEVAIDVARALSKEERSTRQLRVRWKSILTDLTGSAYHFVRWKAVQALYEMDPVAGADVIEHCAARDAHPHVRRAAKAALSRMAAAHPVRA